MEVVISLSIFSTVVTSVKHTEAIDERGSGYTLFLNNSFTSTLSFLSKRPTALSEV